MICLGKKLAMFGTKSVIVWKVCKIMWLVTYLSKLDQNDEGLKIEKRIPAQFN